MTGKMITKLAPGQEAVLQQVRDEWLRIGLATGPGDHAKAEAGVRAAYKAAGLPSPRFIVWLGSPWSGVVGQALAPGIIREVLAEYVQVDGQVHAQVYGQVHAQVDDQVHAQVYGQVDDQVDGQVYGLSAGERKLLADWYNPYQGGSLWAGWLSHYAAMEAIGVTGLEPIHGQQQIARNAGWWFGFAGFAVLTERPDVLKRDPQGRLHCEDGPAMLYPDGWALWRWHGTEVPADLILDGWDADRCLAETNTEVRRCAIERLGWDNFTDHLTPVGEPEPDPGNPGQILRLYDIPTQIYGQPVRVVVGTNGTPERDGTRHVFGLTVPAGIQDPVSAAAWGYEESRDEYVQLQRRA